MKILVKTIYEKWQLIMILIQLLTRDDDPLLDPLKDLLS